MANSKVVTAAKVVLYINGKIYGKVHSFSYTVSTPKKEIRAVDSMEPFEEAPTIVLTSGVIGIYKSLSDGGAEGIGVSVPVPNLPQAKYFSLALVEIPTQNTIFQANKCALDSQNWGYVSRGVVQGTLNFKAVTYINEVSAKTS